MWRDFFVLFSSLDLFWFAGITLPGPGQCRLRVPKSITVKQVEYIGILQVTCNNTMQRTDGKVQIGGICVILCRNDGMPLARWWETWSPFSTPRDVLVSNLATIFASWPVTVRHSACGSMDGFTDTGKCLTEWSGSRPYDYQSLNEITK